MDAHYSFEEKANPPPQRAQKPGHPSFPHVPNPSSPAGERSLKGCSWIGMPQDDSMQHQAPGTLGAMLGASTSRAPSGGSCQSPCGSQKLQLPCREAGRDRDTSPKDWVKHLTGYRPTLRSVIMGTAPASCRVFGHQAVNLQPLWRVSSHLLLAGE